MIGFGFGFGVGGVLIFGLGGFIGFGFGGVIGVGFGLNLVLLAVIVVGLSDGAAVLFVCIFFAVFFGGCVGNVWVAVGIILGLL